MAAEPVFDVRFDHLKGNGLPGGWSYYGSGTHMQLKDGNLVFTNEEPKRESGIVSRIEVEKGFDYEFTVELAEGHPGEKVEGVFLLLTAADGQAGRAIAKTPVVSGNLGQYVSSSMRYSPPDTGKVALYLHSRQGFTPRAKIRRILCQRSADQTDMAAGEPAAVHRLRPAFHEGKQGGLLSLSRSQGQTPRNMERELPTFRRANPFQDECR